MANDIYDALHADHERIRDLMTTVMRGMGDIDRTFSDLQLECTAHERAEEQVFYQPLLRPDGTHEMTMEGFIEHHVNDLVIGELAEATDVRDEQWHAKAAVLQELLEHHLDEEENQLFTLARQSMDEDWAAATAQRYEQAKSELKSSGTIQTRGVASGQAKG